MTQVRRWHGRWVAKSAAAETVIPTPERLPWGSAPADPLSNPTHLPTMLIASIALAGFSLGPASAIAPLASPTPPGEGDLLPTIELVDFAQTPASSFEEYFGQAVLLEFFAHW